jgi:hemolysin activation/secretion protein
VLDTKETINKIYVDTSYLYRGHSSIFYGGVKLSKGVDIFNASDKGDANTSRLFGDQDAIIFEPVLLTHFRPFSDLGTFKAFAKGQMASHTLLSSDLFTVGGHGSVRGFDVAQEAAEMGYNFSLEYSHVLPIKVEDVTFKAGPFLDGAAVYNRVVGTIEDKHFYSVGLTFETIANIIPAGETLFSIDWARPVGNYTSNRISDDIVYFSLKQSF